MPEEKDHARVEKLAVSDLGELPRHATSPLADVIQPDGGLHSSIWYLDWSVGDPQATLDGQFTPDELEAIATHMRKASP